MVEEYDLDKNGKLDEEERAIYLEDRRRKMEDEDAKRDAQRNMTWFALFGMVLYPMGISQSIAMTAYPGMASLKILRPVVSY